MHKTKVSERPVSEHKKRFERKRYLNVIYFIDSSRTRTLKFSIGASYFTVGALTVAVIWSLIATSLLIRDRFVIAEMNSHRKSLLETVFNYQTRYDEVYERAYPVTSDKEENLATEDASESASPVALPRSQDPKELAKSKASSTSDNSAISQSVLPVDQAAIAKDKANLDKAVEGLPISIDNFATTTLGRSLTVRLSLKNLNSPSKSSGVISGVAKFVDTQNQTHSIQGRTTPSGGEDAHFNIRYFKNKNLVFDAPKDLAGKFIDVSITIKDDQGHSKDFPYTINKDIAVASSTASPAKVEPKDTAHTKNPTDSAASPVVKAAESQVEEEHSDAVDTSVSSGATEATNDTGN